jgi:hypothetical protein
VLDRILECHTEEELEVLPKTVTLELKKHMLTLDEFTHITHCEDSLPEEERFERAKRFEEHVIQAASLALALVALEEQRKNPDHPSVEEENGSPSSTKISLVNVAASIVANFRCCTSNDVTTAPVVTHNVINGDPHRL